MIPLPVFILIPITACIIEYFFIKLRTRYDGLIPLVASLATTALSIYIAFSTPGNFTLPWITQWGMDFELSLNGISNIFIVVCSTVFLVQTILSMNKQKHSLYWCMSLLLQAAIFSFVLTQNLAVRIISWELCWIPLFVVLVNTDKGHAAIRFSKIWFIAQTLLICGTIIMLGKFTKIYETAFWFMLTALMIRTYLNVSSRFKPEVTILINVIMPLLPIIFFINTIMPLFNKYIRVNAPGIAIFICAISLMWIFKLIVSKATSAIYTVNTVVFSGLILAFLLMTDLQMLQLCVLVVIARAILSTTMTYYGKEQSSPLNKWAFIISILLSFGFSGPVIGIPLLKIISLWNIYQQGIAIGMLFLLLALFTTTVIKISKLFNVQKPIAKHKNWMEIVKLVAVSIIFLGIVVASIDPSYINNNIKKYSQTNLTGE